VKYEPVELFAPILDEMRKKEIQEKNVPDTNELLQTSKQ
jgi:hypothetical protein